MDSSDLYSIQGTISLVEKGLDILLTIKIERKIWTV